MKGKWEHAAGKASDIRHDWHCIKDAGGKQIACSTFILDLQKQISRYWIGAFSHHELESVVIIIVIISHARQDL